MSTAIYYVRDDYWEEPALTLTEGKSVHAIVREEEKEHEGYWHTLVLVDLKSTDVCVEELKAKIHASIASYGDQYYG